MLFILNQSVFIISSRMVCSFVDFCFPVSTCQTDTLHSCHIMDTSNYKQTVSLVVCAEQGMFLLVCTNFTGIQHTRTLPVHTPLDNSYYEYVVWSGLEKVESLGWSCYMCCCLHNTVQLLDCG